MERATLDYRSAVTTAPRTSAARLFIIVFIGLLAFMFIPIVASSKSVSNWMDATTGTMRWETQWFGHVTESHLDVSPLEKRLTKMSALPARDWRFIHERRNGGWSCGTAPPIYMAVGSFQDLVNQSSDAELLALEMVLQSGADDKVQRDAVESAALRAIDRAAGR